MLFNTQSKNIDNKILKDAIYSTAEHRDSLDIIKNWKEVVLILKDSEIMKKQWERYQKDNFYAEDIKYEDLIESITAVGQII
jgi:hypothetical protein